ncbi:hypothetical protein FQN57_005162 [Myotisia sp. PD_48]|nr:hypothetical protein FQN57_005162 [Myotisia sp. PD_48]
MCGIFFSISAKGYRNPEEPTGRLIRNRGPDSFHTRHALVHNFSGSRESLASESSNYLTFASSVLALRGDNVQLQPLCDDKSESILCWNGEAWKFSDKSIEGNDSYQVFQSFIEAIRPSDKLSGNQPGENSPNFDETLLRVCSVINKISGPFSFVLFDRYRSRLFYGRDCLGRRSLLHGWNKEGDFIISSVRDETFSGYFEEVEAKEIYMIDLNSEFRTKIPIDGLEFPCPIKFTLVPWTHDITDALTLPSLKPAIPLMNRSVPHEETSPLDLQSECIVTLEQKLRESLKLRLESIPDIPHTSSQGAKIAILFSGGLDCTLLARIAHDILPSDLQIDLLNVAFENPRVVAAANKNKTAPTSPYDECPDRKTGISSYNELRTVCSTRRWNLICINIPYTETLEHRAQIKRLMFPHNTEMDLSISCALYFAARGKGELYDCHDGSIQTPYTTSARVLLSGLGADEIFAGYNRHSIAFSRGGFKALIDEVELDVGRLGKRNLGRDDRVISNWGREVRYPYLDEDLLMWVLPRPIWEKCGFRVFDEAATDGHQITAGNEVVSLENGKLALRLLCWKLSLRNVAREKKRAIQFGSRTAKMETGRSKGTHVLLP